MTINKMLEILAMGTPNGSALKELAAYYGCDDYDLSPISDAMADRWIERKEEVFKDRGITTCGR